ncbi:bifunctional adenosylcobinamide kinase/adenosylcobinamide-phosphate guanylyltransferase [Bacillus sp. FJAT-45350]|uniref:bifunctional adenosylcobinamide kinase/adenosylcobinamide-phosphate guanylyltransferase n=1 Tax=Bacillus sp. FJAT-45350 TaxID=2011014 RepID=UPI000BB97B6C|nr:bifunctional adenosylcobinamide kinase/adenosylcobinamide-phosphate guanylyltransferase [Bacillus sp. FJAT-45350]
MHFVTGGAFNGKRKWVKKYYKIDAGRDSLWYNGSNNTVSMLETFPASKILVIEQIEELIKILLPHENARERFQKLLSSWVQWEEEDISRQLVLVGNDICKGIVPLDQEDRVWRDMVGWCYQDIVTRASRVDTIWYGINQCLKNGRE